MNKEVYEYAKNVIDELVSTMAVGLEAMGQDPDSADDVVKYEFMKYMMYLSASDGTIDWEEAKCIAEVCGIPVTPNKMAEFIRENNIYSTDFEREVPVCFRMIIEMDNKLAQIGSSTSASMVFLEAYKAIGQLLVQCDGNVHDNEKADYNIYINMLEEYRDKHYMGSNSRVTGFTKNNNESSVVAPTKAGVSAPRKG